MTRNIYYPILTYYFIVILSVSQNKAIALDELQNSPAREDIPINEVKHKREGENPIGFKFWN